MADVRGLTYNVDLALCIDSTGSMEGFIGKVKQNALHLYKDICDMMEKKHRVIDRLRIRVISFKDYLADGNEAMMVSDFFELPEQADELSECIDMITAEGGGDLPEDGLEALAYAMTSAWNTEGLKKRHLIVIWTDAPTHQIGHGKSASNYPKNMAKDFAELSQWWGDVQNRGKMAQRAKRLVLFAPDAPEWNRIAREWNNVIMAPSALDKGLSEFDYQTVLSGIVNTI